MTDVERRAQEIVMVKAARVRKPRRVIVEYRFDPKDRFVMIKYKDCSP